ncbi:hypothetical protein ACA910_000558 [Epithemia clementina (nom. ined.)]
MLTGDNRSSRRHFLQALPSVPSVVLSFPAAKVQQANGNEEFFKKTTPDSKPLLAPEFFGSSIATAPYSGRSLFPTLTPPFRNRAIFRYNVDRKTWAFEQLLTFVNVTASIRCHVVKLESTGGLWIHSPNGRLENFVSC